MVVSLGKCSLFLVNWLSSGSQHHAMLKVWGGGTEKRLVWAHFVTSFLLCFFYARLNKIRLVQKAY